MRLFIIAAALAAVFKDDAVGAFAARRGALLRPVNKISFWVCAFKIDALVGMLMAASAGIKLILHGCSAWMMVYSASVFLIVTTKVLPNKIKKPGSYEEAIIG